MTNKIKNSLDPLLDLLRLPDPLLDLRLPDFDRRLPLRLLERERELERPKDIFLIKVFQTHYKILTASTTAP